MLKQFERSWRPMWDLTTVISPAQKSFRTPELVVFSRVAATQLPAARRKNSSSSQDVTEAHCWRVKDEDHCDAATKDTVCDTLKNVQNIFGKTREKYKYFWSLSLLPNAFGRSWMSQFFQGGVSAEVGLPCVEFDRCSCSSRFRAWFAKGPMQKNGHKRHYTS